MAMNPTRSATRSPRRSRLCRRRGVRRWPGPRPGDAWLEPRLRRRRDRHLLLRTHSPLQRGTNVDFNGLLPVLPEGHRPPRAHSAADLDRVAQELNTDPAND